jgi:hypothetical protein
MCHYNEDSLYISLISSGEKQPCSKCAVCGDKLANHAMVTFRQSTNIYAKNQFNILKGLQLIKHATPNNEPNHIYF